MGSLIFSSWFLLFIDIAHQQQSILQKDLKNAKFYHPTCVRMWKILIMAVRRLQAVKLLENDDAERICSNYNDARRFFTVQKKRLTFMGYGL